jgi:hypothetical protein
MEHNQEKGSQRALERNTEKKGIFAEGEKEWKERAPELVLYCRRVRKWNRWRGWKGETVLPPHPPTFPNLLVFQSSASCFALLSFFFTFPLFN